MVLKDPLAFGEILLFTTEPEILASIARHDAAVLAELADSVVGRGARMNFQLCVYVRLTRGVGNQPISQYLFKFYLNQFFARCPQRPCLAAHQATGHRRLGPGPPTLVCVVIRHL